MRFVNVEPTGSNVECGVWNVELVALRAMLNYSIMNYN